MAELATLARPYAEALFQVAVKGDLKQATSELDALSAAAAMASGSYPLGTTTAGFSGRSWARRCLKNSDAVVMAAAEEVMRRSSPASHLRVQTRFLSCDQGSR